MSGAPIDPAVPVRVHALSVRDFRVVRALELNLDDGFGRPLERVAIVGPNGSGKTTVLDALALALGARSSGAAASASETRSASAPRTSNCASPSPSARSGATS